MCEALFFSGGGKGMLEEADAAAVQILLCRYHCMLLRE
jgi:hypothetical protein